VLRGNPDAVPRLADLAFQDLLHPQRVGDFGDVLLASRNAKEGGFLSWPILGKTVTNTLLCGRYRCTFVPVADALPALNYRPQQILSVGATHLRDFDNRLLVGMSSSRVGVGKHLQHTLGQLYFDRSEDNRTVEASEAGTIGSKFHRST
jgi:hypothetical protein